jgi:hypothetical protein
MKCLVVGIFRTGKKSSSCLYMRTAAGLRITRIGHPKKPGAGDGKLPELNAKTPKSV